MARLRKDQKLLLWAGSLALVAWLLPVGRAILLPLVFLNTYVHELGHALAAIGTGGEVKQIAVFASGEGVALTAGGWQMAVASAGYVGASLLGAVMIFFGRTAKGAKIALWSLGLLILCGLLLWVRADAVGVIAGALWVVGLFFAAWLLQGPAVIIFTQFLGIMQCLSAMDALLVLFRVTWVKEVQSDAQNMAQVTGIAAPFWAVMWLLISLLLVYTSIKAAWRHSP